jgi:hypothetical protein
MTTPADKPVATLTTDRGRHPSDLPKMPIVIAPSIARLINRHCQPSDNTGA